MRIELGKTYEMAGYKWTAVKENNDGSVLMQSHGVCSGAWPGYVNEGDYSDTDYAFRNIAYLYPRTTALMDEINEMITNDGLYLVSREFFDIYKFIKNALKDAVDNYRSFGASYSYAWLSTVYGSNGAWLVYSDGKVYDGAQAGSCVVAPACNLIPSKVIITDDGRIVSKSNMAKKDEDPVIEKITPETYTSPEMMKALYSGIDLFNVNTGDFLWQYNEEGSIAHATLSHLEETKDISEAQYEIEICDSKEEQEKIRALNIPLNKREAADAKGEEWNKEVDVWFRLYMDFNDNNFRHADQCFESNRYYDKTTDELHDLNLHFVLDTLNAYKGNSYDMLKDAKYAEPYLEEAIEKGLAYAEEKDSKIITIPADMVEKIRNFCIDELYWHIKECEPEEYAAECEAEIFLLRSLGFTCLADEYEKCYKAAVKED